MRTLQTLRQELNHSKQCIDYLKVDTDDPDVGGYEDQVMQEMLSTDLHKHVRQFSMEIHLIGPLVEVVRVLRVFRINRLLQRLYDKGYRLYDITDNVRGQKVERGNPELSQSDLVDEIMSTRIAMFWEVSFVNLNVEGCE
uniref:Uncharacterized protein n=1 Tax=Ciona savignyi TaxID=51511 RepID=H2Z5M4_CIOSA